jgi:two-component system chemotaxis sensor kinase CheA
MDLSREDFNKLFGIFKIECDEHIQKLNSGLISLEENPDQSGLIEEVFREAHSLKGAARMLGFTSIENIAHKMETILGKIKKNEIPLSHEIISLILKSLDTVGLIVNRVSKTGAEEGETGLPMLLNQLTEVSEGHIHNIQSENQGAGSDVKKSTESFEDSGGDRDVNLFLQETDDAIQMLIDSLVKIEKNPDDRKEIENAYEQAHALKGSARIIKHKDMGDISFSIERAVEGILDKRIQITSGVITTLLRGADFIKTFIDQIETGGETKTTPDFKGVLSSIDSLITSLKKSEDGDVKKPKTLNIGTTPAGNKIPPLHGTTQQKGTVRISFEKLDNLMEQTSELIIMTLRAHQRLMDIQSIIEDFNTLGRIIKKGSGHKRLDIDKFPADNNHTSQLREKFSFISERIESLYRTFYDDYRQLSNIIEKLQDDVKKTRLFPIKTVLDLFPRMVRDLSASLKKRIKLKVSGEDVELDKFILEEIKDPLMHVIRNCIDHGIEIPEERVKLGKREEGTIRVDVSYKGNNALIKISDDGKGIDIEKIKTSAIKKGLYSERELSLMKERQILNIIFHQGFSTSDIITDISGRGVGMDVVKDNIEKLNGTIDIEIVKNKGTTFAMKIPLTLSTTQSLKISVSGGIYFLSVAMVERIISISEDDLPLVEGFPALHYFNSFIPYVRLSSVLEIPEEEAGDYAEVKRPVVVLRSGENLAALGIEKFMGEEKILIKGLGNYMRRVRNVSGVTIMRDGNIAPVLNVTDIINTVQLRGIASPKKRGEREEMKRELSVLVVDDSLMTRTLEKNIIESYGYYVEMAVDGQDALLKLQNRDFDIIVSDVQMPNMNGLELAKEIRQSKKYKHIPVILVTALESIEDKKRGIEVGADAYIVKSSFDQSNLLETIKRLI